MYAAYLKKQKKETEEPLNNAFAGCFEKYPSGLGRGKEKDYE